MIRPIAWSATAQSFVLGGGGHDAVAGRLDVDRVVPDAESDHQPQVGAGGEDLLGVRLAAAATTAAQPWRNSSLTRVVGELSRT